MRNSYVANVTDPDDNEPCACGSCKWTGPYSALAEIEDCELTPGDPSPAGRCPECDSLAYVVNDYTAQKMREIRTTLEEVTAAYVACVYSGRPHLASDDPIVRRARAATTNINTADPERLALIELARRIESGYYKASKSARAFARSVLPKT